MPRIPKKPYSALKPNGAFGPRVQAVGPEHFGIVGVDVAKERSRIAVFDFYGRSLLDPFTVTHTEPVWQHAIGRIRQACDQQQIKDRVVAIEMTGTYHRPVVAAFRRFAPSWETRIVHPHASRQFRQAADPHNKTDDTDLAAIFRAASLGFGLLQNRWPDVYEQIRILRRHRRDLVDKRAELFQNIRELLHGILPGFAEQFCHLWESDMPLSLARFARSPQRIVELDTGGLRQWASQQPRLVRETTLHKIVQWARQAPPTDPVAAFSLVRLDSLDDDRRVKSKEIDALELQLTLLVAKTPYILLLCIPGINVVSCADLAGELGPIHFYPTPNAITGRAGLVPSRYQSDRVDCPNGPLVPRGNRRIRAVLTQTAHNLSCGNNYFKAYAERRRKAGKAPEQICVKIAKVLSRIVYHIVSTKALLPHPCLNQTHYILAKLAGFLLEHDAGPQQTQDAFFDALAHFDARFAQRELPPLQELLAQQAKKKKGGPQLIGDTIALIITRLKLIQSDSGRSATS